MAVDVPLLRHRSVTALKVETTTGTPISLSASDAAFNIFNAEITPDIPFNRREGQGGSLDPIPGVAGSRGAKVKFETEIYGAATVPAWGDCLLAAGFTLSSRTYTISTTNINTTTLTMGFYKDGRFLSASGVKLNWNLKGQSGGVAMSTWEGTGLWVAPSAVALLTPSYPTTAPPRVASCTLTIGAVTYKISNFEIDMGNEIVYREDVTDPSGYHSAAIVNRNITVKVDPESLAIGTKDWWADYAAATEAAFVLAIGTSANNITTISMPKLQLAAAPEMGERNGMNIDNLVFQANRSASAGDDSATVVFS